MLLAIATLLLSTVTAAPTDVTGKWDGRLSATRPDGTAVDDSVLLILTQKDNAVTGTVGENEGDRHPITSGKVDGDKVVLEARHAENGREYRLELTLKGDELNGVLTSGDRRADIKTKRRKE
jgi:hypothetical protein